MSNTEMVSELLSCPFCGEKPQITKHHREDIYSFMHRCPVLGPISWGFREDPHAHVEKWNARSQPAEHQGEPVAWEMDDTAGESGKILVTNDSRVRDEWVRNELPVAPLFGRADPGEVERLRAELKLRDRELEIAAEAHGEIQEERDNLRAQLAERDALLRDLEGKTILSWTGKRRISAALSASASAGRPCYGPNEWGTECGKCSKCKHASAEPSAPVERDERADFEAYMHREFPGVILARRRADDEYVNLHHHGAWLSWQARAALERKP